MAVTTTNQAIKRLCDILLAITLIIMLAPVILLVGIGVMAFLGRPMLHTSTRLGKDRRRFPMYKFRSMTNATDRDAKLLPDEQRLVPFGRFIRRTSLDELPQLLNIIRGDMSFLGPRPIPPGHMQFMKDQFTCRFCVRPGISGMTAVAYRGRERTWDEKFTIDTEYVQSYSLLLDVKLFIRTFIVLLQRFFWNKAGTSL